jgi:hypothetical protein
VHGLLEAQVAPGLHAVQTGGDPPQTPLTSPDVHAAPVARYARIVQTGVPEEHSIVEVSAHASGEVHAAPCAHALQTPVAPLHTPVTLPAVHAAPASAYVWSVHTGSPLAQTRVALAAHGFEEAQAAPSVHAMQAPEALQTPAVAPVVHAVPAAAEVAVVQTGAPVEQLIAALVAHGSAEVHAPPQRRKSHVARSWPPPALAQSMV